MSLVTKIQQALADSVGLWNEGTPCLDCVGMKQRALAQRKPPTLCVCVKVVVVKVVVVGFGSVPWL